VRGRVRACYCARVKNKGRINENRDPFFFGESKESESLKGRDSIDSTDSIDSIDSIDNGHTFLAGATKGLFWGEASFFGNFPE
jgi:hypothetical protein